MRFKARGVFLALVAVFAMSAVAASAASAAEPEFKPGTKQAFTGAGGALKLEHTLSEEKVTCSKTASTGEITGASTVALKMTFTGCKGEAGSKTCTVHSKGAKEGEIVTEALKGELGEVATKEATSGVGLFISSEAEKETFWKWEGTCFATGNVAKGNIAAEVTPVETSTKTIKLVFAGSKGKQPIEKIIVKGRERKPEFTMLELVSASWHMTEELTFASLVEVTV